MLHLPGQLAAYLALPLDAAGSRSTTIWIVSMRQLLGVLEEFDLRGTSGPDLPGVFSGDARIATVGVAVNRWIAHHGITLNVNPYLDRYDVIEEPGIGKTRLRYTSMEARRQRHTSMSKVRESMIRHRNRVSASSSTIFTPTTR